MLPLISFFRFFWYILQEMNAFQKGRRYPRFPRVGVAGVVVQDNKVLVIKRGTPPGKGEWNLPGGLVEVGETLEEALKREVREETGLKVSIEGFLLASDRIIRDENNRVRYHYVLLDYLCHVTGGTLSASSDAADARWVSFNHLENLDLPTPVKQVIGLAKKRETSHE